MQPRVSLSLFCRDSTATHLEIVDSSLQSRTPTHGFGPGVPAPPPIVTSPSFLKSRHRLGDFGAGRQRYGMPRLREFERPVVDLRAWGEWSALLRNRKFPPANNYNSSSLSKVRIDGEFMD